MLYRMLKPLSFGERTIPVGAVKRLGLDTEDIQRLLVKGAITPVSVPPLSEIPLWEDRAKLLLKVGILDAEQFLCASTKALVGYLEVEPATIKAWKAELIHWITPAERARGCC